MVLHLIRQDLLLRLITVFEELLDHIIAEHIRHQLYGVWVYLAKDLVLLVAVSGLEFLLNEPGAMLVATEFDNMVINVLSSLANALIPL